MTTDPASAITSKLLEVAQLGLPPSMGTVDGDWVLVCGAMPPSPARAICIYDTSPISDGRSRRTGTVNHPGVQVRVRGDDYDLTWAKCKDIQNTLDNVLRDVVNIGSRSYTVQSVRLASGPIHIGAGESGQWDEFTINFNLTVREN